MHYLHWISILGFYAEIPPLNVFFPESVNKTNIVKKIYSVRKQKHFLRHKESIFNLILIVSAIESW